jgi:hypothetical protein
MNPFAHLKESLSVSRIGTYLRCPLRYFFQYIEKRPWEKVSGALLLGSAVDATAKEAVGLIKQGWQKPRDLELDELFDQFFKIETESPRAPISWGARRDQESTRTLGRGLMEALKPVLFTDERLQRIVDRDVAFKVLTAAIPTPQPDKLADRAGHGHVAYLVPACTRNEPA